MCAVVLCGACICNVKVCAGLHAFCTCTLSSAWHQWELAVWEYLLFTKVNGVNICRVSSCCNCPTLCSCPHPNLKRRQDWQEVSPPYNVLPPFGITFLLIVARLQMRIGELFHHSIYSMLTVSASDGHNQDSAWIKQSTDLLTHFEF